MRPPKSELRRGNMTVLMLNLVADDYLDWCISTQQFANMRKFTTLNGTAAVCTTNMAAVTVQHQHHRMYTRRRLSAERLGLIQCPIPHAQNVQCPNGSVQL